MGQSDAGLEKAFQSQREVDGNNPSWRWASLKEGYTYRQVPEYGTGTYVVRPNGTVCEFKGVWSADGDVLLCSECYEDGT